MHKKFVFSILALLMAFSAMAQNDKYGRPLFGVDGSHISYILNQDGSWTERIDEIDGSVSFAPRPLDHTSVSFFTNFGSWTTIAPPVSFIECLKAFRTATGRVRVAYVTSFTSDPSVDHRLWVIEYNGTSWVPIYSEVYNNPRILRARFGLIVTNLNGDSDPDIVVGHTDGLTRFIANGGTYTVQPIDIGDEADALVSFDVDDDGNVDVISVPWGGISGGEITTHYGDGLGAFRATQTRHGTFAGWNDIEIGNTDLDSRPELVVMSGQYNGSPNFTIYELSPGLPFVREVRVDDPREYSWGLAVADFNDDGLGDIFLSRARNSPTYLWEYRGQSDGTLLEPPGQIETYDVPESLEYFETECSPGRRHLGVPHGGWMTLGIYIQNMTGLALEDRYVLPYASHYDPARGIDFMDVNGDGFPEAFVADYNNGILVLPGACDNSSNDSDGDTVPDDIDCFPNDPGQSTPAEVTGVFVEKAPPVPGRVFITWNRAQANVDIASGRINELHEDSGFTRATCLASLLPAAGVGVDVGSGSYWYLLRARCDVAAGTYGMSFRGPDAEAWLNSNSPCP